MTLRWWPRSLFGRILLVMAQLFLGSKQFLVSHESGFLLRIFLRDICID